MILLEQPAIIEVHYGLDYAWSNGITLVDYDHFRLPHDWRDASLEELLAWFPSDLRKLPPWMILGMLPGTGAAVLGSGGGLVKTIVNLTGTSTSNQTYSPVLATWNSSENTAECGSHGGKGGNASGPGCGGIDGAGGGAGSGGKAFKTNMSLTGGGSMTYHLQAGNSGTGTGQACWANGATLAASTVGICGGADGGNGLASFLHTVCCVCECNNGGDGGPGLGASTVGAKGDSTTAGNDGVGGSGGSAPGGSIAGNGGNGGSPAGSSNPGAAGGNAAIQLINNYLH